jgi:hexosaminidase
LAREDSAFRLANAGYQVVLCSVANLYLDFAYEKDPQEPGYYWGGYINAKKVFDFCPRNPFLGVSVNLLGEPLPPGLVARMEPLAPEAFERLLGIQGQLWGENIRSANDLEYLLLPRLLPLAERAWACDPGWDQLLDSPDLQARMARDWNEFANRLGRRELPRLDGFLGGMGYRVPVPGALLRDGVLHANIDLPGFVLRYTTDGSEPTMASPVYAPIRTAQATVAAFTTSGRRGRSVEVRAEPRGDATGQR